MKQTYFPAEIISIYRVMTMPKIIIGLLLIMRGQLPKVIMMRQLRQKT